MKRSLKVLAAGVITAGVIFGATSCDSQPDADVLQYGSYDTMHVYHTYPQPILVHVSYRVYHSDSRMYSTPSYERNYVKTHTVTRQTSTTTTTRSSGSVNTQKTTRTTTTTRKS